jgi:hypothetical protein
VWRGRGWWWWGSICCMYIFLGAVSAKRARATCHDNATCLQNRALRFFCGVYSVFIRLNQSREPAKRYGKRVRRRRLPPGWVNCYRCPSELGAAGAPFGVCPCSKDHVVGEYLSRYHGKLQLQPLSLPWSKDHKEGILQPWRQSKSKSDGRSCLVSTFIAGRCE